MCVCLGECYRVSLVNAAQTYGVLLHDFLEFVQPLGVVKRMPSGAARLRNVTPSKLRNTLVRVASLPREPFRVLLGDQ